MLRTDAASTVDGPVMQSLPEPRQASSQSSLVLILPLVLRNRLPMLTSISRRCMSRLHNSEDEQSGSRPVSSSSTEDDLIPYNKWDMTNRSTRTSGSPSKHSSSIVTPQNLDVSGVNWAIAGAGVRLWLTGCQQLEDDRNADPAMIRSMHIDALKYMHAALPDDLTPAETDTIVGSLPLSVKDELGYRRHIVAGDRGASETNDNVLRKAVSDSVCLLVAISIFFLPFLMASFNRLLKYEREHQIAEKVLSNGLATMNTLGERGLDLKDSRTGSAILQTSIWIMDGIVGGVNDGLVRSTGPVRKVVNTA